MVNVPGREKCGLITVFFCLYRGFSPTGSGFFMTIHGVNRHKNR